jgi:hypothetical protein
MLNRKISIQQKSETLNRLAAIDRLEFNKWYPIKDVNFGKHLIDIRYGDPLFYLEFSNDYTKIRKFDLTGFTNNEE